MIPLIEIVKDYVLEEGRMDDAKKELYLHYSIGGLRDLMSSFGSQPKREKLDVDTSNNTVNIPYGAQKVLDVYVVGSNGKLVPLEQDGAIFKDKDNCGDTIEPSVGRAGGLNLSTPNSHFRHGRYIGAQYNVSGHQTTGAFRVNTVEDIIEIYTYTGLNNVVVDYLSDIEPINGQFKVHEYFREPIKDWIDWTKVKRFNPNMAYAKEKQYYRSKRRAKRKFGLSLKQKVIALKSGVTQSPKI